MEASHVDRDIYELFCFAPLCAIKEASDFEAQLSLHLGFVDTIAIDGSAIHGIQAIFHKRISLFWAQRFHLLRTFGIGMEEHGHEVTTRRRSIRPAEAAGDISDGFSRGEALQD